MKNNSYKTISRLRRKKNKIEGKGRFQRELLFIQNAQ